MPAGTLAITRLPVVGCEAQAHKAAQKAIAPKHRDQRNALFRRVDMAAVRCRSSSRPLFSNATVLAVGARSDRSAAYRSQACAENRPSQNAAGRHREWDRIPPEQDAPADLADRHL